MLRRRRRWSEIGLWAELAGLREGGLGVSDIIAGVTGLVVRATKGFDGKGIMGLLVLKG